jgi:hypothetical protein
MLKNDSRTSGAILPRMLILKLCKTGYDAFHGYGSANQHGELVRFNDRNAAFSVIEICYSSGSNRPEAVVHLDIANTNIIPIELLMTPDAKRIFRWWAIALMLLVALYSAMGILQAGSIYVGERALLNLRFWGAIMVASLIGSAFCGFYAIRLGKSRPRK